MSNNTAIVPYEEFRQELNERGDEIASLLPSTISRETFINTAIIAVKNNPDLLRCERRSLHEAITKAAHDGLRPDGKEGVIVLRDKKVKDGNRETWIKSATWQHMVYGVRKRARELDGIIIDAQVVYEKDEFDYALGDAPHLTHKPPKPLGSPRGKKIGAYAIFRKGNDILHREIMDADQIEKVRGVSKQPNGMLWTTFAEEGWRKSAVHRGAKTVPCSDKLRQLFESEHDNFTLKSNADASEPISTPVENGAAPPATALPATDIVMAVNGAIALDLGEQNLTVVTPENAVEKVGAFLDGMHAVSRKEWRKANQPGLKALHDANKPIWLKVKTIAEAPDPPENAAAPAVAE